MIVALMVVVYLLVFFLCGMFPWRDRGRTVASVVFGLALVGYGIYFITRG